MKIARVKKEQEKMNPKIKAEKKILTENCDNKFKCARCRNKFTKDFFTKTKYGGMYKCCDKCRKITRNNYVKKTIKIKDIIKDLNLPSECPVLKRQIAEEPIKYIYVNYSLNKYVNGHYEMCPFCASEDCNCGANEPDFIELM
tara:strand:+ start:163 stop:591 length:429 start_codon:yes stop_codon:yes gene_type:complete